MRVRVYYNLHKAVWSVQNYIPGRGWRVFMHMEALTLENVVWKVYEAGRQRVIQQKRKNVHAFGIGDVAGNWDDGDWQKVRYNPYAGPFFQVNNLPINKSERVRFCNDRQVFACNSTN